MIEFIFALVCGFGGLLAGYFMRGSMGSTSEPQELAPPPAEAPAEDTFDQATVNQVAEQLRQVTARVAADVDEHHSQVQKASNALCDADTTPSSESIITAVADLIKANQQMQTKLEQAQERIHSQAEQIQTAEARAMTDALTKVWNRRALDAKLEQCHADEKQHPCSLVLLDVDHFKKFNDTYGHLAGDHVLVRVASMLGARLSEIAFVARYGGEEFAVVFVGRDITACRHQAELARRAIGEREMAFEDQSLGVKVSAGIAQLMPGESVLDWIKHADTALYKSKQSGRDCGHWMDDQIPRPLVDSRLDKTTPPARKSQADGDRESTEVSAPSVSRPPAAEAASPSTLPSETQLCEHFDRLTERLTKVSVELFILVIRCDQVGKALATDDRILRVIRATTRSLDFLGQTAQGDILICMPSANENSAVERAQRIRCGVEQSPAVEGVGPLTVSIGIACVCSHDTYDSVKGLAEAAASEIHQAGGNQLAVRRGELAS